MGFLTEKTEYLRGLAEGMKIDESKDEGKLLLKMLEVMGEIAVAVEELDDEILDTNDRVDEVEECLDEVCEDLYDDECDGDCCDCDCDCDCDDDMEYYEVECPECNEKVYFDEDMVNDESLVCPNCNAKIELEFED